MRVCVYCASSQRLAPEYFEAAERLARTFVAHGVTVLTGGSSVGLMGRIADTMLASGGSVIGIMPQFMIDVEWAHPGLSELRIVADMQERKRLLLHEVDALVALPGGSGTLEELLEAITLKRLGQFLAPIVIVNTNSFFDHLVDLLDRCIADGFMREIHRQMWTVVDQPDDVMAAIQSAPRWNSTAIDFATNL